MDQETFTLTLNAIPDQHDRPAAVRLRLGLKYLLRACALRCTSVTLATPATIPASAGPSVAPKGASRTGPRRRPKQ